MKTWSFDDICESQSFSHEQQFVKKEDYDLLKNIFEKTEDFLYSEKEDENKKPNQLEDENSHLRCEIMLIEALCRKYKEKAELFLSESARNAQAANEACDKLDYAERHLAIISRGVGNPDEYAFGVLEGLKHKRIGDGA